jgi:NAD-dependent SIR2 family protein deacetylase
MANIDNLFFLGSGASVCAGIPTFSTFKDKTEEIAEGMDDTIYKETFKIWKSANYKDYNIEEFYAVVEMDELCGNHVYVTSQNIVKLITATIEKSITDTQKILPYDYLDYIHYPVITTNWDFILDSYRKRLEKGLIDYCGIGKHTSPPENKWDITPSLKILKLHGSLNWGACKEGHLYYFDMNDFSNLKAGTAKCKKCENHLKQFIIPPTFSKLDKKSTIQHNFMSNIWHEASSLLSSCENLYFIGYSFPKTDAQMKYFIMNALQANNNLRKVTVVTEQRQKYGQNNVDFENNYISVLSKVKKEVEIVFNYDGFEGRMKENNNKPSWIEYEVDSSKL